MKKNVIILLTRLALTVWLCLEVGYDAGFFVFTAVTLAAIALEVQAVQISRLKARQMDFMRKLIHLSMERKGGKPGWKV